MSGTIAVFAVYLAGVAGAGTPKKPEPLPPNTFVEVDRSEAGGHYFSQVIYAASVDSFVSWGTQTHHHPIRTYETRHFLRGENRWIDAFPVGRKESWSAKVKQWPDWAICATAGTFYERDGFRLPRPNCSF